MSVRSLKRCPQCGKRPYDQRLEACPECRVPYAYEYLSESAPQAEPSLTSDLLQAMGRQILSSWMFWAGLLLVVAVASWGVIKFANGSLDRRTAVYLGTLDDKSNQRLKLAYDRISQDLSRQMSNQVASEFQSAHVRALVEKVAHDRAQEMLTNSLWPSLEAFRKKLELADAQFANATNELARLSRGMREAQRTAAQMPLPADSGPTLISLVSQSVSRDGSNYILNLIFAAPNGKPLGLINPVAGTYERTAKILNFSAPGAPQSEEPVMNDFGDAAQLKFTATGGDLPILIELVLSGPTIVKLTSDALDHELILPVATSRKQPPAGEK
jgi:hypothetical protein